MILDYVLDHAPVTLLVLSLAAIAAAVLALGVGRLLRRRPPTR